jgi:hypothetical protein
LDQTQLTCKVDACERGNGSSSFNKGRGISWLPSQQPCSVEIRNNVYNGRNEVRVEGVHVAYLTVDLIIDLKEKLGSS